MLTIHRADQRDVVRPLGQVGQNLGHFHAAIAAVMKGIRGRQEASDLVGELDLVDDVPGRRFAGVLLQLGLGIKQVNLTGTSVHK